MVNSKNVAFKVDKQAPTRGPPPQPYATVINCRKPGGKRASRVVDEVRSQQVLLTKVAGQARSRDKKRKRNDDEEKEDEDVAGDSKRIAFSSASGSPTATNTSASSSYQRLFPIQRPHLPKPTKFRRNKTLSRGVDLDCWFTILTFSDPAQLLEMRDKIASCFRFLRDNPTLWKHSRNYYYGDDLPDPPSELSEFQYAHLRHGHGCMSCGTPSTRKTYWAFLRRWCKTCLQSKTVKEHDAIPLFKDSHGEDISYLQKCLPSGIFDSWGNFVGVGPAHTHSLKTVYLLSDVQKIVAEFIKEHRENPATWHAEVRTWTNNKVKIVEERREFARRMELWEDMTRTSRSYDYQGRKEARKLYFLDKGSKLNPPILRGEMEQCAAYRRAIAIPKEPNMTSWLQLKPKLEKEVVELRRTGSVQASPSVRSLSGTATPDKDTTC